MKYILVFLIGFLAACASNQAAPRAPADHASAAADLERKTIALVVEGHVCSGVWISQTVIVTANHCLGDVEIEGVAVYATRDDLFPKAGDPRGRVARVKARDADHDLALLEDRGAPEGHGVAELRTAPVVVGMFAQNMGHPRGLWFSYSSGDVSALRIKDAGDGRKLSWVQSTAPISPGCSGGGLFDSEGRLIGITAALVENAANAGLFVPVVYLRRLLERP